MNGHGAMKVFPTQALLATLLTLLVPATASLAAIPPSERQALLSVYESTGGASWDRNDGWGGPEGSESTWYGVVTDPENSTVLALRLGDNSLEGPIPEALGDLPNLRELDLSANRLEGPLPAALAGLRSLVRLDLSGNPAAGAEEASEVLVSRPAPAPLDEGATAEDGPVIYGHLWRLEEEDGVLVCRLKLFGLGFAEGCEVQINGQPAPKSIFKGESEVVAKGGAKLKKMLPKGQVHQLTVANPDGQVSPAYPFTRP